MNIFDNIEIMMDSKEDFNKFHANLVKDTLEVLRDIDELDEVDELIYGELAEKLGSLTEELDKEMQQIVTRFICILGARAVYSTKAYEALKRAGLLQEAKLLKEVDNEQESE